MDNFKIGDKVVFVPHAQSYWTKYYTHKPINNRVIYTIRGFSTFNPNTGIYLDGIYNDFFMGHELSYSIGNFRKVIEDDNFAEEVLKKVLSEIYEELI